MEKLPPERSVKEEANLPKDIENFENLTKRLLRVSREELLEQEQLERTKIKKDQKP